MEGAIAQLGERLNGIQEVGGSTPPGSTIFCRIFRSMPDCLDVHRLKARIAINWL